MKKHLWKAWELALTALCLPFVVPIIIIVWVSDQVNQWRYKPHWKKNDD